MRVSRKTALEIMNLKEGFTEQELKNQYRRLSKLTHPDTKNGDSNLFRFITCCNNTLLGKLEEDHTFDSSEKSTQSSNSTEQTTKKTYSISLPTLYKITHDLFDNISNYERKYDISNIYSKATVYICPHRREDLKESFYIDLVTNYNNFKVAGYVPFVKEINLSASLKQFKKFNVEVTFLGKSFKFRITAKDKHKCIIYEDDRYEFEKFNTEIDLSFNF